MKTLSIRSDGMPLSPFARGLALLLVTIALLVLSGCATGTAAFREGDYTEAAKVSADRLARSPKNEKASEIFLNAYPQARREWLARIDSTAGNSEDPFRWEQVHRCYLTLRDLANRAALTPFAGKGEIVVDYFVEEIEDARKQAVDARILRGDELLASGDMYAAREAHEHFLVAQNYAGSREDIRSRLEQARQTGTLLVGLDPVVSRAHGINPERLDELLSQAFASRPVHHFVAVVPLSMLGEREAAMYAQVSIGELQISRKESEVGQREFRKELSSNADEPRGSESPRIAEATVYTREKEVAAHCSTLISVYDAASDQLLYEGELDPSSVWKVQWNLIAGDRRAVGDEQFQLAEPPDPEISEMAQSTAEQIVHEVRKSLSHYFHETS